MIAKDSKDINSLKMLISQIREENEMIKSKLKEQIKQSERSKQALCISIYKH